MGYYRIAQRTQLNFRNPLLKLVQHHSSESLYLRKYTRIPFLTFFCRICLWFQRKINKKNILFFWADMAKLEGLVHLTEWKRKKLKKKRNGKQSNQKSIVGGSGKSGRYYNATETVR